jgi:hypothetical protein
MFGSFARNDAAVYLIADHLDAVLAAGEDILKQRLDLAERASAQDARLPGEGLRSFVEAVRTLEMMLVARALQARARAKELAAANAPLKLLLGLFAGGTAALEDAVEELGDAALTDFDTGDDPRAYLRSRGLIAPDAGSLVCIEEIAVTEQFLVVRRIALGPLLDLTARFLDALEDCYGLDAEDEPAIAQSLAHPLEAPQAGGP